MSGLTFYLQSGAYKDCLSVDSAEISLKELREKAIVFVNDKFPENRFGEALGEHLLFYRHDLRSINILQLVNTASEITEGTLVEVVIASVPQCERILVHPHTLFVHSYKTPTFCDFCGEMLFGLVKQGLKCQGCGLNYHKRCASKIPNNCSGARAQTRRPSVIPLSPRNSVQPTLSVGLRSPSGSQSARDFIGSGGFSSTFGAHAGAAAASTICAASGGSGSVGGSVAGPPGSNNVFGPDMMQPPQTPTGSKVPPTPIPPHTPDIFITTDDETVPSTFLAMPMPRKDRSSSWSGRPLWMEVEDAKRIKVPHTFQIHTYTKPTVCQYCKKLLKGLIRQGRQCRDCKYNCHKKCEEFVPKECIGNALTQSPSFMLGGETGSESGISSDLATSGSITDLSQVGYDNDDLIDRSPIINDDDDDPLHSPNIPLQRIVQSKKQTKRHSGRVLKAGWLTHYTSKNAMVKKRHYWRLDTKALTLYNDENTSRYYKEIPLSGVLEISSPAHDRSLTEPVAPGSDENASPDEVDPNYDFLIKTASVTYHISVSSDRSMLNPDAAQQWYQAVRSALMPVTPQSSCGSQKMERLAVPGATETGQLGIQLHSDQDFSQLYQIMPEDILGSGQFGTVYGGVHRKTAREVAVKVIDKLKFPSKQEAALRTEVEILQVQKVKHPGVVDFQEMFETPERIFVVMEKMKGDMLEMILSSEKGRLSERLTRFLIYQILNSLRYLHSQNIVHCDLKPENILLASDSDFPQVKLCDFGFARIIGERSFRRSVVGTPAYLAPEVLRNKGFNRSLDMWSVGVIVYVSLSGTFPFNEDEDINDQIQNAAFMYPPNPWIEISETAVDFINNLLQVKLTKRPTVHKALAHDFLQMYQLWNDLRRLENDFGERYLTHESDDGRWADFEQKHGITKD